ncbi:MAG TPA: ABC transporter permease [Micromonosporaceae bacterium]|nr:ABC transporter permease [Micromonosporaceae bacterium]
MSVTTAPEAIVPVTAEPTKFWTSGRRAGAIFVALGGLALIFWGPLAGGPQSGPSSHARFNAGQDLLAHHIAIPSRLGAIVFAAIAVVCGIVLLSRAVVPFRRTLIGIALVCLVIAFLCWQIKGQTMPLGYAASQTVFFALPLVYGALTGVIGERSAVINVAIEGQLLMGAFLAALVGTMAASPWAGLVAAGFGGVLVAALLAVLSIKYLVDQVVLGVVINLLVLGITSYMYSQLMQPHSESFNSAPPLPTWNIPVLEKIPIIGPALFQQNILTYLIIVLVIVVHIGLFHTRWGLRTRAVGEHPAAADTVGIKVNATRYRNVLLAGVIAGVGGAYFTIGSGANFTQNMTVGKGFIALAAVIFGRWSPVGATLAALLFGFTTYLGDFLPTIGSSIPSAFLSMLPYIATIVAVAGLVGRVRAPAADGKPYVKG